MNADLVLAGAQIVDPEQDNLRAGSVAITDGRISAMEYGDRPLDGRQIIDCSGLNLAPGIVDIGVKVCEPGERHKESFRSASEAAAAGGITTMIVRPDTVPPIDTPEALEFIKRRAGISSKVRVHSMATLTRQRDGRHMTEIGLLSDLGAIAFTDGDKVIGDSKVLARCMTYCRQCETLVIGHPQDPGLSAGASATSGKFASLKGIRSVSNYAERIGLERDLAFAEMTGVRYHADQISSQIALGALERAHAAGLPVTAGVSVHHLTLNELDVGPFRTFFKFKPPLRTEEDRRAMVRAVADGRISVMASMHTPQDEESKRLPFDSAASGAVGLETLLPSALRLYHSGDLTLPTLFRTLSFNPSRLLKLDGGRMAIGAPADLILFDAERPFLLDRFSLRSKCKNTPFDGQSMTGAVIRTFVDGTEIYARDG